MARANKSGSTVAATKGNGAQEKLMAGASCTMRMVTFTKATGSMIKLTAMVLTPTPMGQSMSARGRTISSTGSAWRRGLMAPSTKVNTMKAKRMAMVSSLLPMGRSTQGSFK